MKFSMFHIFYPQLPFLSTGVVMEALPDGGVLEGESQIIGLIVSLFFCFFLFVKFVCLLCLKNESNFLKIYLYYDPKLDMSVSVMIMCPSSPSPFFLCRPKGS